MSARLTGTMTKRTGAGVPRRPLEDVRAAVIAARGAAVDWASRPAPSRGRVLYRLAEVMESRREGLRAAITSVPGGTRARAQAAAEVEAAIDRTIYYAGFCDKLEALLASRDPVSGPLLALTSVEPMGVVAIMTPERPVLLGLVSTVLPAIAAGNACVVVTSDGNARGTLAWGECLTACGLPAGVVEGLAGDVRSNLANHPDVATIHDATRTDPAAMRAPGGQGLAFLARFVRSKTLWHPAGA